MVEFIVDHKLFPTKFTSNKLGQYRVDLAYGQYCHRVLHHIVDKVLNDVDKINDLFAMEQTLDSGHCTVDLAHNHLTLGWVHPMAIARWTRLTTT